MQGTRYIWLSLFLILAAAGGLMAYSAYRESAIMDELPHIPAGYSYVRFFDYRLNPEHPPLMKALSALPLLFTDVNFPSDHKSWTEDVNGQWNFGGEFLYGSGNDARKIVFLARLPAILLTLLTILLVYFFAREIVGKRWALLPALLFGLSPTVLAHGHYVTTDLAATFGAVAAIYAFTSLLLSHSRGKILVAGAALGVAELMKFSNALLVPFFVLLVALAIAADYAENRRAGETRIAFRKWKAHLFSLLAVFAVAGALIYSAYFLFTANYPRDIQVRDTRAILTSFPNRAIAEGVIRMAGNPVTGPAAHYATGLMMVVQRSTGGNTGYFMGEISSVGWRHYFPAVFALKEPIPSLLLVLVALAFGLGAVLRRTERGYFGKFADYLGLHFQEFALALFIAIYWAWSIKSNLNIGVRHLLPTLPMIYMLATCGIKKLFEAGGKEVQGKRLMYLFSGRIAGPLFRKNLAGKRLKGVLLSAMIIWFVAETAIAFPHFISYFNELGGGKWRGYRIVTDSNYDWGQDLYRLEKWTSKQGETRIAVDYFGGGNPEYSLGASYISWNSAKGDPGEEGISWLAVSVNTLTQAMAKEREGFFRDDSGEYAFLRARNPDFKEGMDAVPEPDARIGTSIFLYKTK